MSLGDLLHLHIKDKYGAMSNTIWYSRDSSSALLDNLLHDCQAKSDSIMVYVSRSMKLSKSWEKLRQVFSVYSSARVSNLTGQKFLNTVIVDSDVNTALESKLQRVLDEIDQYLLESSLVAHQKWQFAPTTAALALTNEILVIIQSSLIIWQIAQRQVTIANLEV